MVNIYYEPVYFTITNSGNSDYVPVIFGLIGVLLGVFLTFYLDFLKKRNINKELCLSIDILLKNAKELIDSAFEFSENQEKNTDGINTIKYKYLNLKFETKWYPPNFFENLPMYTGLSKNYYEELCYFFFDYYCLMKTLGPTALVDHIPVKFAYNVEENSILTLIIDLKEKYNNLQQITKKYETSFWKFYFSSK